MLSVARPVAISVARMVAMSVARLVAMSVARQVAKWVDERAGYTRCGQLWAELVWALQFWESLLILAYSGIEGGGAG